MNINQNSMKITYKWFDGRYTQTNDVEVEKCAEYEGHDIYKDKDGWFYVNIEGDWNYYAIKRHATQAIKTYNILHQQQAISV